MMRIKLMLFVQTLFVSLAGYFFAKALFGVTLEDAKFVIAWMIMLFVFGNSLMVLFDKQLDFVQRFLLTTTMQLLAMLALFLFLFKKHGELPSNIAFTSLIMYMLGVIAQSVYLHRYLREK